MGYSLREFAEKHSISYDTLKKINRGEANPTISTLSHIAKALNCSTIDLIDEKYLQGSTKYIIVKKGEASKHFNEDLAKELERTNKKYHDLQEKVIILYGKLEKTQERIIELTK